MLNNTLNLVELQARAKLKRAQAALLQTQAEALELQANSEKASIEDTVRQNFTEAVDSSEAYIKNITATTIENVDSYLEEFEEQTKNLQQQISQLRKKM